MTAWTESTNPHTTTNIREIRDAIANLAGDLKRVTRDGEPTEAQREAIDEAWRLLGQAHRILAPAGVYR